MGGGQDKPAWTACPLGVKITKVGGKITRDSLPPGGQAVQGGKINCYTGKKSIFCSPALRLSVASFKEISLNSDFYININLLSLWSFAVSFFH